MASKYENISRYLMSRDEDMLRMSFKEIEKLIEGKLPPAAYEHRAWWANTQTQTHARHGWMKAGWETSKVDMDKGELVFIRSSPRMLEKFSLQDNTFFHRPASPSNQVGSIDAELEAILRRTGGVVNLSRMVDAVEGYIRGDLLETELGQILRKHWPRGIR